MRHKNKNKTRPLFTLSLEMTKTRLLLVPGFNLDIYCIQLNLANLKSLGPEGVQISEML